MAFGSGAEADLNACVAWALADRDLALHGYFEGYSKAAMALLSWVREEGTSPEYAVWPIAFLWRHHVELGLKRIIAIGHQLDGEGWTFPAGHNLQTLWRQALPFVEQSCDEPALIANVAANIQEMMRLDPTAAGFRYPLALDQQTNSLKSAPDHVNLAHLDRAMRAVSAFLDAIHSLLDAKLEMQIFES